MQTTPGPAGYCMTDAILSPRHATPLRLASVGVNDNEISLAFDFERTPPMLSIQMYSAIADPFWSSFMYFINCASH
jgi:hypothetical protein